MEEQDLEQLLNLASIYAEWLGQYIENSGAESIQFHGSERIVSITFEKIKEKENV